MCFKDSYSIFYLIKAATMKFRFAVDVGAPCGQRQYKHHFDLAGVCWDCNIYSLILISIQKVAYQSGDTSEIEDDRAALLCVQPQKLEAKLAS